MRTPTFSLRLLGSFELASPLGVVNLGHGKLAGLLTYLACTAPRPQSREKLSALLWGAHYHHQAKQNLRQALARLRRVLGEAAIESDGESIWLNEAAVAVDVSRFEALILDGGRDSLSAAVDLYRGSLIDDVTIGEEEWGDWLASERGRMLDLALGALVLLSGQELTAGRPESALKTARRAITLNGLREDAHRLVVQALVATGRRAEALRHYQDLVGLLKRELETEPDAATTSLVARLRATSIATQEIDNWVGAGRQAFARRANRAAVDFLDRALEALAALPECTATLEQSFDIRLDVLPQALLQLGELRRTLQRLQEARLLADRLNDDRRRCRVLSIMTIAAALSGDLDEAASAGTKALEIARRLGDLELIVPATTILEQAHFYRGEHERVAELAAQNLALLPDDSVTDVFGLAAPPSIYDRGRMIISLAELGRFGEAAELSNQAIQLAGRTRHAYTVGWAHIATGWSHLLRGDWEHASLSLDQAHEVVTAENVMLLRPLAAGLSAWALAQLGQMDEAGRRLLEGEQLLERLAVGGLTSALGWFCPWLGRTALLLGRFADARRLGERALAASPRQPGFAAHAVQLLADIAAHPEQFDFQDSEARFRQALALAESCGMRPVMAHCHLGLGHIFRGNGSSALAAEHLATARTMYHEMGMRSWLERADAETVRRFQPIEHADRSLAGTCIEQVSCLPTLPAPRLPVVVIDIGPSTWPSLAVPAEKPVIAVLPFGNMRGDLEQECLADGVSEDIITALSRFHELAVVARGSSFTFKGSGLSLQRIADQLGAQYVLSGTLRKATSRIRISAELTSAESDVQLWSDRYDRALADTFDLQDDISRTVAACVERAVRVAEIERARRKPPADVSAYDLYLLALPPLWSGRRLANVEAIELLRQSLELDSNRAPALAALAWGLAMATPLDAESSLEFMREGLELVRRAIEQDGTDSFARAVYAFVLFGSNGANGQGLTHARDAVRLNASSAFAWGVLGMIGSMSGEYEQAIESLERALTLSPCDRILHLWLAALAASCFALGRHDEGAVWARRSVEHNPGNGIGHRLLAANLAAAGRLEEARDVTRNLDAEQRTTIREIRARRYFKQEDVLDRYLAAQRMAGFEE